MRNTILFLSLAVLAASLARGGSAYDFTMKDIDGKPLPIKQFNGKVVLFVNVASRCGYTPQYAGLESLYRRFKDRGLVVVGVPANNFGAQEPGTNEEIKQFCSRNYNVTFPMLSKVSVKGADIHPLYAWLTSAKGGDVRWNFTKFLVGKNGQVLDRFEPSVAPESPELVAAIENALK
jgi:glutathione peroxidase